MCEIVGEERGRGQRKKENDREREREREKTLQFYLCKLKQVLMCSY